MKIAFAGGPASGKTETMEGLQKRLATAYRKKVIFLPEVATSYLIDQPCIIRRLNKKSCSIITFFGQNFI